MSRGERFSRFEPPKPRQKSPQSLLLRYPLEKETFLHLSFVSRGSPTNYNSSDNEINQFKARRKLALKVTPHTGRAGTVGAKTICFARLPRNAALKRRAKMFGTN